MNYRHLTLEPRYQIAALYRAGHSNKQIAAEIGCHPRTIGRELRRNGNGTHYGGKLAHQHACLRRRAASARPHLPAGVRDELIVGNLPIFSSHQKWSWAASASFCIGVMPPSAMFGRSWL